MRQRLTPEAIRLTLWIGTLTYCGIAWCWYAIDTIRDPNPDPER
jgi:hypothetical protein